MPSDARLSGSETASFPARHRTMKRIPTLLYLLPLALLGLHSSANADKVFLKATSSAATGNASDYIEGKVIDETEHQIVLRIEGGQMTLKRDRIARIEKDAMTTQDIEEKEGKAREVLAQANEARRAQLGQWAEASAKRREDRWTESDVEQVRIEIDFQGLFGNYVFRSNDPILRKMNFDRLSELVEEFMRSEVKRLTGRSRL